MTAQPRFPAQAVVHVKAPGADAAEDQSGIEAVVKGIVATVREKGDGALRDYSSRSTSIRSNRRE